MLTRPLFLVVALAGCLATPAAAGAQVPIPAATPAATPSQVYRRLAAECLGLLRKAAALPDAQGVALLQRQAPPLQARAEPATRALAKWLKQLPPAQLKAEENQLTSPAFEQDFQNTLAALKAKKRSPAFRQLSAGLLDAILQNL